MQTATVMLALAGDPGNTIPKFDVTPAEVAVLRLIHGDDAVHDINPSEDVERTNRAELARLREIYRKPAGSHEPSAVDALFPGAAARVFENFDELELDESFYKADRRVKPKAAAPAKPVKGGKKAKDEPEQEAAADDGVGDINDGVGDTDGKTGIFG